MTTAFAAAIAVLVGLGAGIGIGFATAKSNEAIARQPEAGGDLRTAMIIALAIFVACSISLDAPVEMEWKISSSAARPPVKVAILFSSSSLDIRKCSFSST